MSELPIERNQSFRKSLLWLFDASIIVGILLFFRAPIVYFGEQRALTQITPQIIDFAIKKDMKRLAVPDSFRTQVDKFLSSGIVPILYDSSTPRAFFQLHRAQGLVRTDNFFSEFGQPIKVWPVWKLGIVSLAQVQWKDFPLSNEEGIAIDFSRPYLYQPLGNSFLIDLHHSAQFNINVDSGDLRLDIFGFGSSLKKLEVSVSIGAEVLFQGYIDVDAPIAQKPQHVLFHYPSNREGELKIEVRIPSYMSDSLAQYFLHSFAITNLGARSKS